MSLDNWYNQIWGNIQMRQARSQRKESMTEWLGEAGEGMRDRWVDGDGGGGGGEQGGGSVQRKLKAWEPWLTVYIARMASWL